MLRGLKKILTNFRKIYNKNIEESLSFSHSLETQLIFPKNVFELEERMEFMKDFFETYFPIYLEIGSLLSQKNNEIISLHRESEDFFESKSPVLYIEFLKNYEGYLANESVRLKGFFIENYNDFIKKIGYILTDEILVESPILSGQQIGYSERSKNWCDPLAFSDFTREMTKMFNNDKETVGKILVNLESLPDRLHCNKLYGF